MLTILTVVPTQDALCALCGARSTPMLRRVCRIQQCANLCLGKWSSILLKGLWVFSESKYIFSLRSAADYFFPTLFFSTNFFFRIFFCPCQRKKICFHQICYQNCFFKKHSPHTVFTKCDIRLFPSLYLTLLDMNDNHINYTAGGDHRRGTLLFTRPG